MKKIYLVIVVIWLLTSCIDHITKVDYYESSRINIKKYYGSVIKSRDENSYRFDDMYILKNDSFVIEVLLPKYLKSVYNVGDTIK